MAEYVYRDALGNPVAKKQRFEPGRNGRKKDFNWQHWKQTGTNEGEWRPELGDVKPGLYRWPEVKESQQVILTVGEKDADKGATVGLPCATTGGVNSWRVDHADYLAGRDVVIIADRDERGREHAYKIAESLFGKAAFVKVIELPQYDLSDALAAGVPARVLQELLDESKTWRPPTGADLLHEMRRTIRRWIAMDDAEVIVCTLWIAHTHAISAANYTPYIWICSPVHECGKTNLSCLMEYHAANPLRAVSISQSSISRAIEKWKPTLILDEFDTIMRGDLETREMIRCVLNAGFDRGQVAVRNVGQGANMEPAKFDTFGAKIIAGIGRVDETLASRCIPIRLKQTLPGQYEEGFDKDDAKRGAEEFRPKLAAWIEPLKPQLREARPTLPKGLRGRKADISKPLLVIADAAGESWPELSRSALMTIFADERNVQETEPVKLLRHMAAFIVKEDGSYKDFIPTPELIEWLTSREDRPWAEYGKAKKPITGPQIAKLLRGFYVAPTRGYTYDSLADAFARYVKPFRPARNGLGTEPGTDGQRAERGLERSE